MPEKSPLIRPLLMGLVAGQRAMTPLAALAGAARRGALPDNAAARLMRHPLIAAGGVLIGAAEMAGDKMKGAPDRTVALGLFARGITASFSGYALAPKGREKAGAALCAATALAASFAGLALRKRAMRRGGQTVTGFAEEALLLPAALAIATVE